MVSIAPAQTKLHSVCLLSPDDLRDGWGMPHVLDLPDADFGTAEAARKAAERLADACAAPADPWLGEPGLVEECAGMAAYWGCRLDECSVVVLSRDPSGEFWDRKKTHTFAIAGRLLAAVAM